MDEKSYGIINKFQSQSQVSANSILFLNLKIT